MWCDVCVCIGASGNVVVIWLVGSSSSTGAVFAAVVGIESGAGSAPMLGSGYGGSFGTGVITLPPFVLDNMWKKLSMQFALVPISHA